MALLTSSTDAMGDITRLIRSCGRRRISAAWGHSYGCSRTGHPGRL